MRRVNLEQIFKELNDIMGERYFEYDGYNLTFANKVTFENVTALTGTHSFSIWGEYNGENILLYHDRTYTPSVGTVVDMAERIVMHTDVFKKRLREMFRQYFNVKYIRNFDWLDVRITRRIGIVRGLILVRALYGVFQIEAVLYPDGLFMADSRAIVDAGWNIEAETMKGIIEGVKASLWLEGMIEDEEVL